jgi:hypothetical protein
MLFGTRQCSGHSFDRRIVRVGAVLAVVLGLIATSFATNGDRAAAATASRSPNSADRMVFWSGCADLINMKQSELVRWHTRGVDGFTCVFGPLWGSGGAHRFTGKLNAVSGKAYDWQRYLRISKIATRAHKLGMKLYLGFYFSNTLNAKTPLGEWFDDASWTQTVLPEIAGVAGAAKALGFDGLAVDQELYSQNDGRLTATWDWDYPGNTHTESEVRSQVKTRGAQIMETIVAAFPKVEILAYDSLFPDTWDELVQEEVNGKEASNREFVFINLWDGLTSVSGYESIQFVNAVFFKTFHIGTSWDNAYTYEYNRLYAMLSQRLSNWAEAAGRVSESPFVWISNGSTDFEVAQDPDYVTTQLAAARRWGMDRSFTNYTYDNLKTFDYEPYVAGMQAASKPAVVDDVPPRVLVDQPSPEAGSTEITVSGTATDDQAIRVVRWKTDDGKTGAATMEWESRGDPDAGWSWKMNWKADGVPLHPGVNRIEVSAEDIKGLFAISTVTVTN